MSTNADASLTLVRNATVLATVGETTFLVDPLFAPQGALPPIDDTPNDRANPLVPMPDVDRSHDAVIVTHRHPDHFDDAAKAELIRTSRCFASPPRPTRSSTRVHRRAARRGRGVVRGVTLHRTPGRHGHGERAERMGPVSGFVLEGDETLYLAGDTVWYEPVAETLARFEPDAVVLNGGAARFNEGSRSPWASTTSPPSARPPTPRSPWSTWRRSTTVCSRARLRSETEDVLVPEDGEEIEL